MYIEKGYIFYADLGQGVGSEQGGVRPVVVVQNNIGNKYSPTVIVAPITSKIDRGMINQTVVHMVLNKDRVLNSKSIVLTEQIRTIDKSRLDRFIGRFNEDEFAELDEMIKFSFRSEECRVCNECRV